MSLPLALEVELSRPLWRLLTGHTGHLAAAADLQVDWRIFGLLQHMAIGGATKSRFSGRGWGQQLFSFQSPAVQWIAQTSSLNCLSCRNPYQTPDSLNCLPPFSPKTPFFSLKSASSHPLPKNQLWATTPRVYLSFWEEFSYLETSVRLLPELRWSEEVLQQGFLPSLMQEGLFSIPWDFLFKLPSWPKVLQNNSLEHLCL